MSSHNSRSLANLSANPDEDFYEQRSRSSSLSKSRMVVERTEVKQGKAGGFMQVEVHEISMAMETMLDNSEEPPYRMPITVNYGPTVYAEYVEDAEEWALNGNRRARSHTNESTGGVTEIERKRARFDLRDQHFQSEWESGFSNF